MRWILNRMNGTGLIGKKVRIGPSFIYAAKDVVSGTNGYSGNFGDEEASMLWFNGKGVEHFKKSSTGVAEDTESADGEIYKVDRFELFFEFG